MQRPKILTLDIETAPLEAWVWSLWKQNVGLNQIVTEWSLLSYAARWLGTKKVIYKDNRNASNPRDDGELLDDLWLLLNEADIVVAQNGKKFDLRKIKARFVMLGYHPFSPVRVIDTMLEARAAFAFTSSKLEWMSDKLTTSKKLRHEKFPGFELWKECLAGNVAAWEEMRKYNIQDIKATEELYLVIRPWIQGHPNITVYDDHEHQRCPCCGSEHLTQDGHAYTQSGQYLRYLCEDCGAWSRSRYTINTLAKRKATLSV
jgi:predicted RNA-binding Zn-ribbon protein involved in translation (DUF1610 family)